MPLKIKIESFIGFDKEEIQYGKVMLSVDDIERTQGKKHVLLDTRKRVGGQIWFEDLLLVDKPSFVEYLKSGWFINLAVAIDFTASNKDRHKIIKDSLNDYETAIREVGKILEPYAYK